MSSLKQLLLPYSFCDIHTHTITPRDSWSIFASIIGKDSAVTERYVRGIHPWFIPKNWESEIVLLDEKCKGNHSGMLAIGEIGLDSACNTPMDIQLAVFKAQLNIAEKYKYPVVIHCVKKFGEVFKEIQSRPDIPSWIFHWYSGSNQFVDQLKNNPCFFSFGKDIVKGNGKRRTVLLHTPLDRILFETDDWEGTIEEVYTAASTVLELELIDLCETIKSNVANAFLIR